MPKLLSRFCAVDVDGTRVTDLRIAFKVVKALTKEPNTLDVTIYNLAENSRRKIQKTTSIVRLFAGYVEEFDSLFVGNVTLVSHVQQGPDWITHIQGGDGSVAARTAKVNESFRPGTDIVTAMKTIGEKTTLPLGNLIEEISKGNIRNTLTQLSKGFVAHGSAVDELEKLAKNIGREVSIQDGVIQVSNPDEAVGSSVVLLTPETGLIGSPEYAQSGEGAKKKTVLKARSLIQQRLLPGRRISLRSKSVGGLFRIEKVTYTGDTHAQPWYADLELKAIAQ